MRQELPLLYLNPLSLLLILCCVSHCFAEKANEISAPIKQLLNRRTVVALQTIVSNCSKLYDNDNELLKAMFVKKRGELIWQLLNSTCNNDDVFYERAVAVGAKSAADSDYQQTLKSIYEEFVSKSDHFAHRAGFLMNQCAINKNYTCLGWFGGSKLCRLTDTNGKNILHMAMSLEDDYLYEFSAACPLLMDYCDNDGVLPMEYVHTPHFAKLVNERWLEVAKMHLFSLRLASIRQNMCDKFEIISSPVDSDESKETTTTTTTTTTKTVLSETLLSDFTDLEDYYCPYLKMKINVLDKLGVDDSGLILEWLSYLLSEMFTSSSSDSAAYFKWDDAKGSYTITGNHSKDVYEKLGAIKAVANYFGLSRSYQIVLNHPEKETEKECYDAFIRGQESPKFLRLEQHYDRKEKTYKYVLKGKHHNVNINFNTSTSSHTAPHSKSNIFSKKQQPADLQSKEKELDIILKAADRFSLLNDREKLNLIKSGTGSDLSVVNIDIRQME